MILCTLLITACGGKKTQVENDNAVSDSITERQQYRFECQFIKADDGNYDSIVVRDIKTVRSPLNVTTNSWTM